QGIDAGIFRIKFLAKVHFIDVSLSDVGLQALESIDVFRAAHSVPQPALKPQTLIRPLRGLDRLDNLIGPFAFHFHVVLADQQGSRGNEKISVREAGPTRVSRFQLLDLVLQIVAKESRAPRVGIPVDEPLYLREATV